MKRFIWPVLCVSILSALAFSETTIPGRVQVQPVFFVPSDENQPTKEQQAKLVKHLLIAQKCYKVMLKNRDTFEISDKGPLVYQSRNSLDHYKTQDRKSLSLLPIEELFKTYGYDRFNCPYIYVVVFMNSKEDFPVAGGRPFNRGFNNGGGFVYISSYSLGAGHFQSTLLHELGHSFGLVHVESYRYDMKTNLSIMSYNQDNWWNGFKIHKRAGSLIPEDLRALNYNKRAFPAFSFNSDTDIPKGYKIYPTVVLLTTNEDFSQQKAFAVSVQSSCPQLAASSPQNIVHKLIWPLTLQKSDHGIKGFDCNAMWMTELSPLTWGNLNIRFPIEVKLTKICLYFDCGGQGYIANKVKVATVRNSEESDLTEESVPSPECSISFTPLVTDYIRVKFQAGASGKVVFRGIRFFTESGEIFCPDFN